MSDGEVRDEEPSLREQITSRQEKAALLAQIARLEVECQVLREGAAIIRETAAQRFPAIANTPVVRPISECIRDEMAMAKEVDARLSDPSRTWWTSVKR